MLSRRLQLQVIVDLLAGLPLRRPQQISDFEEPWRTCARAIAGVQPDQRRAALLAGLRDHPNRAALLALIDAGQPGVSPPSLPTFADLAGAPSISWLWPGWIPLGMLTLLGAAPGTGKSYVALDLARRVVAGEPFPDGARFPEPHPAAPSVLYVDAECNPPLLRARLSAWTFDPAHFYILQPRTDCPLDLARLEPRERLIEAAFFHTPSFVVIDSFSAVNSLGENNVEQVRDVLTFLSAFAADYACAVLLIHHLRKRSSLSQAVELSQDDFRGSSHVTAAPRCVLGLTQVQTGPHPDRNAPRRLEVVKSNLVRSPQPLGITFESLGPDAVRLVYGSPPRPYRPPTQAELCAAWLLETLQVAAAPQAAGELVELARAAGYSRGVLFRARAQLAGRILDTEGRHSPSNRWRLAPEPAGAQQ